MRQTGRSMIEMLAVLAVIAVVSIGGLLGYRYAMDTHKANSIFDDVNRFEFSISERIDRLPDGEIDPLDFTPFSGFTMDATNELEEERHRISVHGVPKGVCRILLNKGQEKYVLFVDNFIFDGDLSICDDAPNEGLMVSFYFGQTDGLCSVPDVGDNSCSDGCLCPEGFHCEKDLQDDAWPGSSTGSSGEDYTVCCPDYDDPEEAQFNKACNGECVNIDCPPHMRYSFKDCECVCQNPLTMVYDAGRDDCVTSTGACIYSFTQQAQTATADCQYEISTQTQTATGNCSYTIRDYDDGNDLHHVTMTLNGSACPSGQYCYLSHFDSDCATAINRGNVGASTAETIWGTCVDRTAAGGICNVTTVTTNFMTAKIGCPTGQYCYISHFDQNCTSAINRGDVGASAPELVWGTCVARTAAGGICNVHAIASGGLTETQGCPAGQYCYLKWEGTTCSKVISRGDVTGEMLGSCIPRTSNTVDECPITTN